MVGMHYFIARDLELMPLVLEGVGFEVDVRSGCPKQLEVGLELPLWF